MTFLSVVPSFPNYKGPFSVGTAEYEIPVSELASSSPVPDAAITTIKFRIFYPCGDVDSKAHPNISWLPEPQNEWFKAYCSFLTAPPRLSKILSRLPLPLKYSTIPASSNAPPLSPKAGNWPVMIFSHGLGGSFNAYSYLLGSLASCGVFCIAPEHRDQSAPITLIQGTDDPVRVLYKDLPHDLTPEILAARNSQLRIRLWEMELVYTSLFRSSQGDSLKNVAGPGQPLLNSFKLDLAPSKVTWGGHSFGAATAVQLVKSVYWNQTVPTSDNQTESKYEPIYTPGDNSLLQAQISQDSPLVLLDPWLMALRADSTRWLYDKPLPCYERQDTTRPNALAIMSDQFFKWTDLMERVKAALSPQPAERVQKGQSLEQQPGEPLLFYAPKTAHLSQSDFGLLFPFFAKTVLKAEEPERTLILNTTAILQLMKNNNVHVENLAASDPIIDGESKILQKESDIPGWTPLSL